MKIAYILATFILVIIGGYILFHSISENPSQSFASELATPTPTLAPTATPTKVSSNSKTQILKASYGPPFGFYPTEFTIKAEVPVRLEVTATENGRGCMGSITIPGLNDSIQFFKKGQIHTLEFTAPAPGDYQITCAMGVPHATITVN